MGRNIEIKARIKDVDSFKTLASKFTDSPAKVSIQHDTFFNSKIGRLKLRLHPEYSWLMYYNRPNEPGPKLSEYVTYETKDAEVLREVLRISNGIIGTLEKTRTLYTIGQTRVHVDEVKGLGNFMELEVVLGDHQDIEDGKIIADEILKEKFNIADEDLISCAYIDLLLEKKNILKDILTNN